MRIGTAKSRQFFCGFIFVMASTAKAKPSKQKSAVTFREKDSIPKPQTHVIEAHISLAAPVSTLLDFTVEVSPV